jgi:glucose-6-phosphate 1-epimerase
MSILRTELLPGYPILEITHPTCTARIAMQGAHLLEWTPAGEEPVLYLSPAAVYRPGIAIRGGIPICWPWFGAHPSDPQLPAHGFARNRIWEQTASSENADGVTLNFLLTDDAETRLLWPHAFRLHMEMSLGTELTLSLRMENPGAEPITLTAALHTYLTVGDIQQVRITGLAGASYLDTVGPRTERVQTGEIQFSSEVDRIYASANEILIHDAALGRALSVQGSGSQSSVVWNPWIAKSRTLPDLPDEAYRQFLCVETTNAWQDNITIPSGASHTLGTRIAVVRGA